VSSALPTFSPPTVTFFRAPSKSYVLCGSEWQRVSPEEEARMHTGFDRVTREPHIGASIVRRPNGLLRMSFDLVRLDVRLRPSALARLERAWKEEAENFSKPLFRAALRRTHFSRVFVQFEVLPERDEQWKAELSALLENPASYETANQFAEHK
jgi:hypothetical protein